MDLNGNYAKFIPSHSISPHQLLHGPSSWFSQRHAAHHEAPRHVVRRGAGGREGTAEVATQAGLGVAWGGNMGKTLGNHVKMREDHGKILGKCGKMIYERYVFHIFQLFCRRVSEGEGKCSHCHAGVGLFDS